MKATGYHPLTNSWRKSWLSLFGRPHNEFVNVTTHLFGAAVAAYFFIYSYKHLALPALFGQHPIRAETIRLLHLVYPFPRDTESITLLDAWAFSSFFIAAITCFGCSATFHTATMHSQKVSESFNRLDYIGIAVLITGTIYPAVYYAFYCDPALQILYIGGATVLGSLTVYFVLTTGFEYRRLRTWLFIGLGGSGVIPVTHKLITHGFDHAVYAIGARWLAVGGLFYITGALMYAEHWPECLMPGKFDIVGNSHQIFHVCCLFAALAHYVAICTAFNYRHYAPGDTCT